MYLYLYCGSSADYTWVVLAVSAGSSSRVARIATTGMTTDVYPRENCLAPDYEST